MNAEINELSAEMINTFVRNHPKDSARMLDLMGDSELSGVVFNQPPEVMARTFMSLSLERASKLLLEIDEERFRLLSQHIRSNYLALLLKRISESDRKDKLKSIPESQVRELEELMEYPLDTAGGLMDAAVFAYQDFLTVDEVLDRIRNYPDSPIMSICVLEENGKLVGVVPMRDIALAQGDMQLIQLIKKSPEAVHAMTRKDDVVKLIQSKQITTLPVLDLDGHLLGIITNRDLFTATQDELASDMVQMVGAGKEERALSKPWFAVKRRMPWLQINLLTAIFASAVVAIFEGIIAEIAVLAVLLPLVAGQSGNTGAQAMAITVRGLTLREIRVYQWFKVVLKEMKVGFLNGFFVALVLFVVVYLWRQSLPLCGVISLSMIISMTMASMVGALVPILLVAFKQDPAQSSSIILTTFTDIIGFFSFLGLAALFYSMLIESLG